MQTEEITTRQQSYLHSLIEEKMDRAQGAAPFTTAADAAEYAIALNLMDRAQTMSKEEASAAIDILKAGSAMGYAKANQEFGKQVLGKLQADFGGDFRAINAAAKECQSALDKDEKIRSMDSAQAYRDLVLNPMLQA